MRDLVVVGLGYVGLPLLREASRKGFSCAGLDVSSWTVESLSSGRSHVDDISDKDIVKMLAGGTMFTNAPAVLKEASTIAICVPTPLSKEGGPDLTAVELAASTIAENLSPGTLVILESTTWPGTTDEFIRPILESSGLVAGQDFALAFSPERIDPGNPTFGLANTPKVVGGLTPACSERAREFYSRLVDLVVVAKGTREAEMAKLLENTYRQVNIALVNEMAKFSHDLGIDIWDVVRCAATKPFGFQPFRPGAGVGGHCIPIDPTYLSHRVKAELGYPFRFVELAQEVNRSMPHYVVSRVQELLNDAGLAVNSSGVLVLGVTYKPMIADERESPARPLGMRLLQLGARLSFYDPYVEQWQLGQSRLSRVPDLELAVEDADVVLHLQPHTDHQKAVRGARLVFDTTGLLDGPSVVRL